MYSPKDPPTKRKERGEREVERAGIKQTKKKRSCSNEQTARGGGDARISGHFRLKLFLRRWMDEYYIKVRAKIGEIASV